jgi:putative transposase
VRTTAWVYAAPGLNVSCRLIIGWQVTTPLYTDALQRAIWRRQAAGADMTGLVHHSDPWSAVPGGALRPLPRRR